MMASYSAPTINTVSVRRSGSCDVKQNRVTSPDMKTRRIVTRCVAPPRYATPVIPATTVIRHQVENVVMDNDKKLLLETLKESLSTIREALGSTGHDTSIRDLNESSTQLTLFDHDLDMSSSCTPRQHLGPVRKISAQGPREFSDTVSCSTRSTTSESELSRIGSEFSGKKASGSFLPGGPTGSRKHGELHDAVAVRDWLAERMKDTEQENASLKLAKEELSRRLEVVLADFASLGEEHRELQQERTDLQADLQELRARQASLEDIVGARQAELSSTEAQHSVLQLELLQAHEANAALQAELAQVKESLRVQMSENERLAESVDTIGHIQTSLDRAQQELRARSDEVTSLSQTKREMEMALRSYHEHAGTSDGHLLGLVAELEVKVDNLSKAVEHRTSELQEQQHTNRDIQDLNETLNSQLLDAELRRIELHSSIRDWRDGVRVFCRVRQVLESELDHEVMAVNGQTVSLRQGADTHAFSFDRVFGVSASQETLYGEVTGLVQSALDGYVACIFAYGQTGAGKTYTMQGTPEAQGLIPRSLEAVFQTSQDMRLRGWQWSVQVSIMEVYNETLRDLLDSSGAVGTGMHNIVPDAEWGHVVTGMIWAQVASVGELTGLMEKAARRRSTGSTNLNASSSRSHMVVSLFLRGENEALGKTTHGVLHLVDLAGSERLDKSGVAGDRLKETLNINKSLSSLASVFAARSQGSTHIPFRNSKLTHLLEPCLSGRGKTLMLVHVKANQSSSPESLCSLRFAKLVSQCDSTGGSSKGRPPRGGGAQPSVAVAATGNAKARSCSPPVRRPANAIRGSRTGRTRSPGSCL